ncbi:uncharacterized protein LOC113314184 isoform X2 [Papaver somniferum]|nr:uncharacterized protein LOC113314184 isoform X2 [Papaver somniferum]
MGKKKRGNSEGAGTSSGTQTGNQDNTEENDDQKLLELLGGISFVNKPLIILSLWDTSRLERKWYSIVRGVNRSLLIEDVASFDNSNLSAVSTSIISDTYILHCHGGASKDGIAQKQNLSYDILKKEWSTSHDLKFAGCGHISFASKLGGSCLIGGSGSITSGEHFALSKGGYLSTAVGVIHGLPANSSVSSFAYHVKKDELYLWTEGARYYTYYTASNKWIDGSSSNSMFSKSPQNIQSYFIGNNMISVLEDEIWLYDLKDGEWSKGIKLPIPPKTEEKIHLCLVDSSLYVHCMHAKWGNSTVLCIQLSTERSRYLTVHCLTCWRIQDYQPLPL